MSSIATYQCIAQGCTGAVEQQGDVCADCRAVFDGYMVYNPEGQRPTSAEVAAADARLRHAYEQQATTELGAAQQDAKPRRRNQTCWLCTERRTCTQEEMGWECDLCRPVR